MIWGYTLDPVYGIGTQAVILSTDEIPDTVRRVADYFRLMKQRIEERANVQKTEPDAAS